MPLIAVHHDGAGRKTRLLVLAGLSILIAFVLVRWPAGARGTRLLGSSFVHQLMMTHDRPSERSSPVTTCVMTLHFFVLQVASLSSPDGWLRSDSRGRFLPAVKRAGGDTPADVSDSTLADGTDEQNTVGKDSAGTSLDPVEAFFSAGGQVVRQGPPCSLGCFRRRREKRTCQRRGPEDTPRLP